MAMYPFTTLADGTEIVHSHLMGDGEEKYVEVHFERPSDNCFDSARISLPSYKWIIRDGYTNEEIATFEQMCRDGAHIFFKYAEMGGIDIAKVI